MGKMKMVYTHITKRMPRALACDRTRSGFTLVEIIVSFAILALVATAVIVAVTGIAGVQQRDLQAREDGSMVEGLIAQGAEATESSEEFSLELDGYALNSTTDTYREGLEGFSVLNTGSEPIPDPETVVLDGDQAYEGTIEIVRSGYYRLEVWGASGGGSAYSGDPQRYGGAGGYATGIVYLDDEDVLFLHAGGRGGESTSGGAGGYSTGNSGGGRGAIYNYPGARITGGGGAASDICINSNSLNARVIVAGGGGGAGNDIGGSPSSNDTGGYGGGQRGGDGTGTGSYPGDGATLSKGGNSGAGGLGNFSEDGSFGRGGSNTSPGGGFLGANARLGGGGGGGWYGGGAGSQDGGGGGSAWILTPSYYNSWTNAGDKNNYLLVSAGQSDYWLEGAFTTQGNLSMPNPRSNDAPMTGMRGNGYVRVSWVGETLD